MRLTPPTFPVFLIAILLAALSVVSMFYAHIPVVHGFMAADHHRYWIMVAAFAVMTLGVILPGL